MRKRAHPPRITLTRALAWAASMDAGNRSARKAGRQAWAREDLAASTAEFDRLWPPERDGFPPDWNKTLDRKEADC